MTPLRNTMTGRAADTAVGQVAILGVNGAFGARMARVLADAKGGVLGIDLAVQPAAQPGAGLPLRRYLSGDVTAPDAAVREAVGEADCVVACLPEPVTEACVADLLAMMQPASMLVAILSVHGPFFDRVHALDAGARVLGLNPLFAPSLDFAGQAVIAMGDSRVPRAPAFLGRLRALGAQVTSMAPEDHDRHMAAVQVATHGAILAFGRSLALLGYDVNQGLRAATPPHRVLLALLGRIAAGSAAVYGEIQCSNPYAGQAREALARSLDELARSASSGDAAFADFFERAVQGIAPRRADLARACADMFAHLPSQEPPLAAATDTAPEEVLSGFRRQIDGIDEEIIDALSRRLGLCRRVAEFKRQHEIPMMQPHRVEEVKRRAAQLGARHGLAESFMFDLYALIIDYACRVEDEIIEGRARGSGEPQPR